MTAATALPPIAHLIAGQPASGTATFSEVRNPATGALLAAVPAADAAMVDRAVQAARAAWPSWAATPLKERVQVLFRYRGLLEAHRSELADLVTAEHGKIRPEAEAEVDKAMELCEFAVSLPQLAMGEVLEVSRGIECRVDRQPLGVVASIVPFNFPIMVPHWTIPNAVALGNCMILKPSERVPLSAMRCAELLAEAGLPPGVLNIVHGGRDTVEALCDHPGVAAVSFVGSTLAAEAVYRRATGTLKRALALGGAKNHLIVLPDADPALSASTALASAVGCAGQRCMAASVMVAVSATDHVVAELCAQARAMVPGRDYGPVISAAAKERITRHIADAVAQGAELLVDGRGLTVPGGDSGYWLGPTVLDRVRPGMRIAREEVFGPVLAIMRAESLEAGLALQAGSPYGNAASIFTTNGAAARTLMQRAEAGMIGVNVGVPVPREPFGFGGWHASRFGVGDITGKSSIGFWTQDKKTTVRW